MLWKQWKSKMPKGSNFEREICKLLSLWWTNNKREDVFWRTSGSGARATTRSKTKQTTFGQYGDIQATEPIGQPLIDLCTITLKRGYSKSTFADLVEESTTHNAKHCMYAKFIKQARHDHNRAGSFTWMLIVKRDRRKPIVIIPYKLFYSLQSRGTLLGDVGTYAVLNIGRLKKRKRIFVYSLEDFLQRVNPKKIKSLCRERAKRKR